MADGQAIRLRGQTRTLDELGLRLTHIPVKGDEDGIGELRRNRVTGPAPRFQQLSPFKQWCPPSKSPAPLPRGAPSRIARAQKNWLLSAHPEACIWDSSMASLLRDEVSRAKADGGAAPASSSSLLAAGEISDVRSSKHVRGQRVVALASGESGRILRIISIAQEEWSWADEDATVRLNELNAREEGVWSQDERPITLVKFVRDIKARDPIRWILVQTAHSTTVLDPELRRLPEQRDIFGDASRRGSFSISANPLFSIETEETGRGLHTDVSFNSVSYRDWPQLAIIDQFGHWTVWDVECRNPARPKVWRPVLRVRGHISAGKTPRWPLRPPTSTTNHHRILWLSRPRDSSKTWDDPEEPEESDSEGFGASGMRQMRRAELLLLCSNTTLRIFDLRTGAKQAALNLLQATTPRRILAVQPCPFDPSQLFVLTSTTLFWLAAKQSGGGTTRLDIVLSCSHQRHSSDETLGLGLSPVVIEAGGRRTCLACIRSAKDAQLTTFWFTVSTDEPAQYYRDALLLEGAGGHTTLLVIPLRWRAGTAEPATGKGRSWDEDKIRFYQLVALGPDLALSHSLCVWSDQRDVDFSAPDIRLDRRFRDERKRLLDNLSSAFFVPDTFDERTFWEKPDLDQVNIERRQDPVSLARQVSLDVKIPDLFGSEQQYNHDELSNQPSASASAFQPAPARDVIETIDERIEDGRMPLHTFFDLLGHEQSSADLCGTASTATREPEELVGDRAGRVRFKQIQPDSLLRAYSGVWSTVTSSAAANHRQEGRQQDLRRIAALETLSNLGVSVTRTTPILVITRDDESEEEPPPSSQPSQSTLYPAGSSPPNFRRRRQSSWQDAEDALEDEDGGDKCINLLRKYTDIEPLPHSVKGPRLLVTSHWDLGGDTSQLAWRTQEEELDDEDVQQRRRKREAQRRREDKIRAETASFPRAAGSVGAPSRIFLSSQVRVPEASSASSQIQSELPESMSQVVPGPHGGRPRKRDKKGKRGPVQGFR